MKNLLTILLCFLSLGALAQTCANDSQVEVAVKFTTTQAGTITGIKFFKCATGTYQAKIYAGNTLVTSASITGTGNVTVPVNVAVTPGVVYTASYWTTGTYQYLSVDTWPIVQGPITYNMSVYRYGANNNTLPSSVQPSANYFITVNFVSSAPPKPDTVYVHDNVFIHDTVQLPPIYVYDRVEVPVHDTIRITVPPVYVYHQDTLYTVIHDTMYAAAPPPVYIRDTIIKHDTIPVYIINVCPTDSQHYMHDTLTVVALDTLHALYGWDAFDTTYKRFSYKDFLIVELPTFNGKKIRYVHSFTEFIRREEWDELTQTWIKVSL